MQEWANPGVNHQAVQLELEHLRVQLEVVRAVLRDRITKPQTIDHLLGQTANNLFLAT